MRRVGDGGRKRGRERVECRVWNVQVQRKRRGWKRKKMVKRERPRVARRLEIKKNGLSFFLFAQLKGGVPNCGSAVFATSAVLCLSFSVALPLRVLVSVSCCSLLCGAHCVLCHGRCHALRHAVRPCACPCRAQRLCIEAEREMNENAQPQPFFLQYRQRESEKREEEGEKENEKKREKARLGLCAADRREELGG